MGAHNRYIRMPWGKFDANTNVTIVTNFTKPNIFPKKNANVNQIPNIQISMGAHNYYICLHWGKSETNTDANTNSGTNIIQNKHANANTN